MKKLLRASIEANTCLARRRLLKLGLAAAATAGLAPTIVNATNRPLEGERSLSFYNTHTGEKIRSVFWADGTFVESGLKEVSWILRDFRTGDIEQIDPQLLNVLHNLRGRLETQQPIHIISGYRSPATNTMLRHSGGGGVAKGSLHMQAKAIDLRVPGVELSYLHKAAKSLQAGGVGYYPSSDFVHVDVGRVRYW